jgi:hypothetical protein
MMPTMDDVDAVLGRRLVGEANLQQVSGDFRVPRRPASPTTYTYMKVAFRAGGRHNGVVFKNDKVVLF